MTKADMIKALQEKAGLQTKAQTETVFDSLLDLVAGVLKSEGTIALQGFGSFKVVERAARKGRNPRTGEEIMIPAGKNVKFTPSKNLKEEL